MCCVVSLHGCRAVDARSELKAQMPFPWLMANVLDAQTGAAGLACCTRSHGLQCHASFARARA
jgi:hypothetical protein